MIDQVRDTDPADVLSMPVEGVVTQGSAEGPLSDAEWLELLEGVSVIAIQDETVRDVSDALAKHAG